MLFSSVLAAAPRMPMPVVHNAGVDSLGYPPMLSSEKHSPVFMSSLQQQQGPPSQYYDGKDGKGSGSRGCVLRLWYSEYS